MQLSIITPLFNRLELTRACLESGRRTLGGWDYEWILIDDGSTDGTRDFLATLAGDERIRAVLNDAPRGYAANNNLGARMARAPLLCLLNNDTSLLPGWIEPMARLAALLPDVACVGNVQRETFTGLLDHCGMYFDDDGRAPHAGQGRPAPPPEAYIEWPAVTAACCVVRRKLFLDLGGFDEGFRNGYEDIDFCLRAGTRGYRHFVANRSVIYHHVSASPGRKQREEANLRRFQDRWLMQLQTDLRSPRTVRERRQEGRRYLRKHRWRPWRYNLWRALRALEMACATGAPSRRLELAPRLWLEAREVLAGRKDEGPGRPGAGSGDSRIPPRIFLVVDHTARHAGYAGVPTVVRCLAAAFGRLRAPVCPVLWQRESRSLCLLPPEMSVGLESEALRPAAGATAAGASLHDPGAGTLHDPGARMAALHQLPPGFAPPDGAWILLPEVMYEGDAARLLEYARGHRWRVAVILHDALPTNEPQFFPPGVPNEHALYLRAVSGADRILPICHFAEKTWQLFAEAKQLPQPLTRVCTLPADTLTRERRPSRDVGTDPSGTSTVRLLCVSTVEPRKNHRVLMAAFERAVEARPDLELRLTLVGAHPVSYENVGAVVHATMDRHPGRISWHEAAPYSTLQNLYEACDFTVFPSELEGFGLPILESLWFGRPCICADFGAMAETAAGGGCVTVDVRDPQALAEAILSLAASPDRLAALRAEIEQRPLKTWEEYAAEVLECLPHG